MPGDVKHCITISTKFLLMPNRLSIHNHVGIWSKNIICKFTNMSIFAFCYPRRGVACHRAFRKTRRSWPLDPFGVAGSPASDDRDRLALLECSSWPLEWVGFGGCWKYTGRGRSASLTPLIIVKLEFPGRALRGLNYFRSHCCTHETKNNNGKTNDSCQLG